MNSYRKVVRINPFDILRDEHTNIKRVLRIIDSICDKVEQNSEFPIPVNDLRRIIKFIRDYADHRHHAKEEKILFTMMVLAGYSQDEEPLGTFIAEHTLGRVLIGALSDAVDRFDRGDPEAKEDLLVNAQGFSALLTKHICCEDLHLFTEAEEKLSKDQIDEISAKFKEWDEQPVEVANNLNSLRMIGELEALYVDSQ